MSDTPGVVAELTDVELTLGNRPLWRGLTLSIERGEFIAVLGPNGSGKTSLLRMLLGQLPATTGSVEVAGNVGYVPQQHADDADPLAIRGRDLVGFGVDGASWGVGWRHHRTRRALVDAALAQVDASGFADRPFGLLSGGEQQRLRIAQALTRDPDLLLCDEPLSSLDPGSSQRILELLDQRRRLAGTALVFVTHEINPVLPYVDRVLYLAGGRFVVGTPADVMTSEVLTALYGSRVDVARIGDRLVVLGTEDGHHCADESVLGG
ncbi:metal ABC transporter ATP-binding protein [Gordonia crocea]|uniref:Putative ABC transporter ATP-binding protein n=1 Tax=Gordonia crocea TaxID=589162 RepID=A0A7I9V1J8_9ACTN|nr:metal ABC transporter ATP-binding protein [Gordonia crocea]GED99023.1 putative ABC transporter ATP-binding protein [Gordonia crocea]